MPKVNVINMAGAVIRQTELPESYFGIEPNAQVVSEYVRMYLNNQRHGCASTKNRKVVRGGGRKPYRQKGTGRARQGSTRAPHFVGGGRVFGPTPRDYYYQIPQQKRQLALKSALASRSQDNKFLVLDKFELSLVKTKEIVSLIKNLKLDGKKYLFVLNSYNQQAVRCIRNMANVEVADWHNLNAYDVLHSEFVIMEQPVIESLSK